VASPVPTAEDRPLEPISVYGWTKKQQEEQCSYVAKTFGMPVTMLRYFNVYGSRQSLKNPYTGVVSIFYSRILADQPIYVYERGTPGRDFIHISDVVQANLAALERDTVPGACINVGSGQRHSILDVAGTLAKAIGKQARLEDRGEFRVGDIHFCYADQTRARQLLGIEPQVSLEAGLQEFVAWARNQQSVDLYQQTVDELQRHGLFGKVGGTP
jgi:dTDP-L-rhamnose 4-epimerase